MSPIPRIVLVTPNHLAANPRVLKEADALASGGFDVHVVFGQRAAGPPREQDAAILAHKPWSWTAVRAARTNGELMRFAFGVVRREFFALVPARFWHAGRAAEESTGRAFALLMNAVLRERADLYIAHYPEGLAAAGLAVGRSGAMLGFDAEDFHTGEPNGEKELARTDFLQRRYLPRCQWLTAASAGIAQALAERYEVDLPKTIYNVFPLADRQQIDGQARDRRSDSLSIYWYSQTIGLDRGIQDAILAAGKLGGPIEIHLRGSVSGEVRAVLERLARDAGVADHLFFHEPVAPSELLSRAAEHDVGLALEHPTTINRSICTTNKLFFYLLAGLAVAATDVPGQRLVLANHSDASGLYRPGDVEGLANMLEIWRRDRRALLDAKEAALKAARCRWNWEYESEDLVRSVRRLLQPGLSDAPDVVGEDTRCLTL